MKQMQKFFSSRTNWTIIALFALNAVEYLAPFLKGWALIAANGVLSMLALYFKMNPSQQYGTPSAQ